MAEQGDQTRQEQPVRGPHRARASNRLAHDLEVRVVEQGHEERAEPRLGEVAERGRHLSPARPRRRRDCRRRAASRWPRPASRPPAANRPARSPPRPRLAARGPPDAAASVPTDPPPTAPPARAGPPPARRHPRPASFARSLRSSGRRCGSGWRRALQRARPDARRLVCSSSGVIRCGRSSACSMSIA